MAKTLPWFRMYSEAIDDPKLKLLAYEDRWHFVALLCCKCQGLLDSHEGDLMRRMVAVKLGLDSRELDEVARRLAEVDLIDRENLQPLAWDDRQFQSDSSTERVQKWREKQKKQQRNGAKRCGNVSVTAQDTDTDTDKGSPNGESGKQGFPPTPCQQIVDLYHETCPHLSRVMKLTPARRDALRARWRNELPDIEHWQRYFATVAQSDFLSGRSPPRPGSSRPFIADFDFLIKQANCVKVMEGKYDD